MIRDEHGITLDHNGVHMRDGRMLVEEKLGNYADATRVATHERTPAHVAAVLRPDSTRWVDVSDFTCSIGRAYDAVLREASRQLGINQTGRLGHCEGCAWGRGSATPSPTPLCRAEKRFQHLFADLA